MSHSCHSSITLMSHSCHTHVTVLSHSCRTHVTLMSQSCHTHVTLMSQSCHTHVALMPHSCHSPVTLMSHSCHTNVIVYHTRVTLMSRSCHSPVQYSHLFTVHPTNGGPAVPEWSHRYLVAYIATCKVEKGKAETRAAEGEGIIECDRHRNGQLVVLLWPNPLPNSLTVLHK